MRVLKETNIGKIMLSRVQYIMFIGICVCTFSVNSAVDIVVCEDDEGNKTFQKACPPGTFVVGEKKFSVGKDSSNQVDLSKLNIILYTVPDCETCEEVKIYLKSRDVPFNEIDVTKDLKSQKELTKISGKLSVPLTVIGDEFVSGYDRVKIGGIIDSIITPQE